mmetsp:Transcript_8059/g.33260  ORF Transcript_8059/g.33260 Transcript_8059/m.33260 type:complete len:357 (-) Transcript_8059:872-1942(-)
MFVTPLRPSVFFSETTVVLEESSSSGGLEKNLGCEGRGAVAAPRRAEGVQVGVLGDARAELDGALLEARARREAEESRDVAQDALIADARRLREVGDLLQAQLAARDAHDLLVEERIPRLAARVRDGAVVAAEVARRDARDVVVELARERGAPAAAERGPVARVTREQLVGAHAEQQDARLHDVRVVVGVERSIVKKSRRRRHTAAASGPPHATTGRPLEHWWCLGVLLLLRRAAGGRAAGARGTKRSAETRGAPRGGSSARTDRAHSPDARRRRTLSFRARRRPLVVVSGGACSSSSSAAPGTWAPPSPGRRGVVPHRTAGLRCAFHGRAAGPPLKHDGRAARGRARHRSMPRRC